MKQLLIFIICSLFITLNGFSQIEKYTISGSIKDVENGEDLIGVNVIVKEQPGIGTISNVYGFYSLTLPKGKYTIVYRYIGYDIKEFPVTLDKNITNNIEIKPASTTLKTVEVTGEKEDNNIRSNEMSVSKIEMKEIENIPVLFGERDVMKTVQLLPGIKSAGEGNAGFYVRGGAADQNLILLDEAPVYNASHLLGFFSVFNSDAIKDVKIYKGGIPAEYGGRLSSVMDIKMKDGNSKQLGVSGGVGLISSKLTVEAPIVKNKGSFIISGRRTYADVFLKLSKDEKQKNTTLYFYDLNLKANYRLGKKDRIFLSGYFGRDKFGFGSTLDFDWGNSTGTLRWNHLFTDKLFSNTSLIFSNYSYKIALSNVADITSNIQDFNLKQDFGYYINDKNTLKFGGNSVFHKFKPGEIESKASQNFNNFNVPTTYSLESALYVSNEQKISPLLTATYGLRYSNFSQLGPGDIYSYDTEGEVVDTTTYKKNKVVESYNNIAPRIGLTYILTETSSVKASYNRTYQYLHLLSNTTSSSPTDVWIPSSNNVKPEAADQFALGYFRNFKDNTYEFSVETYYKLLDNAIDYRIGAEVTLNETAEGELIYGEGRAYGAEFFVKRRKGKTTGWLSYTIARSEKQFNEVNQGAWYPARQDRTHDISIVLMHNFSERVQASTTWVYYTGNAVTFPTGKYVIDGQIVNYYTERNGYRMPDYHRLDVGLTLKNKPYKVIKDVDTGEEIEVKRKVESSWNFSIYNLYARENAYSIYFRESENEPGKTEAVRLSLFKIIPSISYNFKF